MMASFEMILTAPIGGDCKSNLSLDSERVVFPKHRVVVFWVLWDTRTTSIFTALVFFVYQNLTMSHAGSARARVFRDRLSS